MKNKSQKLSLMFDFENLIKMLKIFFFLGCPPLIFMRLRFATFFPISHVMLLITDDDGNENFIFVETSDTKHVTE